MRVAGVWVHGEVRWLAVGDLPLAPLSRVTVRIDQGEVPGVVAVTPEQLVVPPARVQGEILAIEGEQGQEERGPLPGADLPPLGLALRDELVTAVSATERTVTLTRADGTERVVPLDEMSEEQA